MVRCDFCRKDILQGTGKKYVKKDGKVIDFCSMKCEKNLLKLGRKARTTKWTGEYHNVKEGKKV
jgi:large subunit ribosomal protein L24e